GVDKALRDQGLLPPLVKLGDPPPEPQPFGLIDQNHLVIIPGKSFALGQKIQKELLATGVDIEIDGTVVGTILSTGAAPKRSTIETKYLDSVNRSLLIAALGGAIVAFLLGLFIARKLTQPLRDLIQATHAMAQGNLTQRVPVRSEDELGELAHAFNKMSADLKSANQAQRQMTADIAHDLRNPLTVIGGYLEGLRDGVLQPTRERMETMYAEVQHLERLVVDLRTLSLADSGELVIYKQIVKLTELLEKLTNTYQHQADLQGVQLKVIFQPNLPEVLIDSDRIEQALGNLVSNALRYTPPAGEICLSAEHVTGGILLRVCDNGSGIAPEVLLHIFERSYRGDASRHGNESGLGLSIARSIVELHGGSIHAKSDGIGKGAEFIIFLPTAE
ncbi:MAG: ATP-binding protein, partial [Chloroflexota bacterium]